MPWSSCVLVLSVFPLDAQASKSRAPSSCVHPGGSAMLSLRSGSTDACKPSLLILVRCKRLPSAAPSFRFSQSSFLRSDEDNEIVPHSCLLIFS